MANKHIEFNPLTGNFDFVSDPLKDLGDVTSDPTGFVNRTDSDLSFVDGTRTFSISVKGPATQFQFYVKGRLFTKTTTQSVVIPNTSGKFYIWFDSTGTLAVGAVNVPWDLSQVAPVTIVYWNATTAKGICYEERHGLSMSWATHQALHLDFGTQLQSTMAISGYTLNTDTLAAVTVGIGTGTFADEDIRLTTVHAAVPANPFEQVLNDPALMPIFYRSGASGDWVWDAPVSDGRFTKTAGTGRVAFNNPAGPWTQVELTNTNFVNYYICAIPAYKYGDGTIAQPIIVIQGQAQYASLALAQAENLADLSLGTLPFDEMVPLYKITYNTSNAFAAAANRSRIQAVTNISKISSPGTGAIAATDHNSLGGRSTANSHPATAISVDAAAFAKVLDTGITDVQLLAARVNAIIDSNPIAVDVADGGTVAVPAFASHYSILVQGVTPVTFAAAPFGAGPFVNGTIVTLIGLDSTNTVTLNFSDAANGAIINGASVELGKYSSLTLRWVSALSRWVEVARNNIAGV